MKASLRIVFVARLADVWFLSQVLANVLGVCAPVHKSYKKFSHETERRNKLKFVYVSKRTVKRTSPEPGDRL